MVRRDVLISTSNLSSPGKSPFVAESSEQNSRCFDALGSLKAQRFSFSVAAIQ